MSSSYGEFEARVSCVRDDEFHEIDDEYQESPSVNDDELQESSSVSNDESHESSESDVGSDNESDGGYPAIYDSNESSESDESDESTGYSSGESTEFSDGKYDSEYNALSDSEVESTLENMGLRRTEAHDCREKIRHGRIEEVDEYLQEDIRRNREDTALDIEAWQQTELEQYVEDDCVLVIADARIEETICGLQYRNSCPVDIETEWGLDRKSIGTVRWFNVARVTRVTRTDPAQATLKVFDAILSYLFTSYKDMFQASLVSPVWCERITRSSLWLQVELPTRCQLRRTSLTERDRDMVPENKFEDEPELSTAIFNFTLRYVLDAGLDQLDEVLEKCEEADETVHTSLLRLNSYIDIYETLLDRARNKYLSKLPVGEGL
jgi:hypothetical protein